MVDSILRKTYMDVIIGKVQDENGWMGNMSPFPVEAFNRTWRTTEALFQAMRFEDDHHHAWIREAIRAEKSPMAAKLIAKKHKNLMEIEPCSYNDLLNMDKVLRLKLAQHPKLIDDLLATGDRFIVEDCTKRQRGSGLFWGAAFTADGWNGQNHLGKLWMMLRDQYMNQRLSEKAQNAVNAELSRRNMVLTSAIGIFCSSNTHDVTTVIEVGGRPITNIIGPLTDSYLNKVAEAVKDVIDNIK